MTDLGEVRVLPTRRDERPGSEVDRARSEAGDVQVLRGGKCHITRLLDLRVPVACAPQMVSIRIEPAYEYVDASGGCQKCTS